MGCSDMLGFTYLQTKKNLSKKTNIYFKFGVEVDISFGEMNSILLLKNRRPDDAYD
jgi:hypothetical protein